MRRRPLLARLAALACPCAWVRGRAFTLLLCVLFTATLAAPATAAAPKTRAAPSARWQGLSPLGVPNVRRPATLPEPPRPPFLAPDQAAPNPTSDPAAAADPADLVFPAPPPGWMPPGPPPPQPPPGPPPAPRPNPARAYEAGLSPIDGPTPLSLEAIGRLVGDRTGEDEPDDDDPTLSMAPQGLYLRLLAGPTRLSINAHSTDGGDSSRLHGWGLGIAATAGGWVAPGFALAASVSAASVLDPTMTGTAIAPPVGSATLSTFALGLDTLYRIDVIASTVSLGAQLGQVRLVDQSTAYVHSGTRLGPGLAAGIDKQWRIGDTWWIGGSARGSVVWPQDLRRAMDVTAVSVCLGLSLGYD